MKKIFILCFITSFVCEANAQYFLSLDSCRQLALRNNKQLSISKVKKEAAMNVRKAARTKFLPRLNAYGSYSFFSKEISLLNDNQKSRLSNLGTTAVNTIGSGLSQSAFASILGELSQEVDVSDLAGTVEGLLNKRGSQIVDAFRTDTRNIFTASIMVTQPIFMGGRITAINKIADYSERMADIGYDQKTQEIIYNVENAYWLVVSLKHKQQLANKYLELVKTLGSDVQKMINQGVATRADGLTVDVKINEAEMQKTQADNGLSLAKMYLSQLCGLPISDEITLADENAETLNEAVASADFDTDKAIEQRPELQMLQTAVDITGQVTKMARADYMPMIALTGGYLVSNPNVFNGFQNKFGGVWNVGVLLRVPIWNWFETAYKIRASKSATTMAKLEYDEAKEKIELQLNQSSFKVKEANKKYAMTLKNTEKANENLRCANLGFKEGVISSTTVMEAQTAWLLAQTQKIDAAIDVKMTEIALKKAMGELTY